MGRTGGLRGGFNMVYLGHSMFLYEDLIVFMRWYLRAVGWSWSSFCFTTVSISFDGVGLRDLGCKACFNATYLYYWYIQHVHCFSRPTQHVTVRTYTST